MGLENEDLVMIMIFDEIFETVMEENGCVGIWEVTDNSELWEKFCERVVNELGFSVLEGEEFKYWKNEMLIK